MVIAQRLHKGSMSNAQRSFMNAFLVYFQQSGSKYLGGIWENVYCRRYYSQESDCYGEDVNIFIKTKKYELILYLACVFLSKYYWRPLVCFLMSACIEEKVH